MHITECEVGMVVGSTGNPDYLYTIVAVDRQTELVQVDPIGGWKSDTWHQASLFFIPDSTNTLLAMQKYKQQPKKCTCDIHAIMRDGCRCGGV